MLYTSTMTSTLQGYTTNSPSGLPQQVPNSTTLATQQTIEVMDFDGQNYLLNHTTTMNVRDHPVSFSMIEKMNKTGYSTYVFNFGNTEREVNNECHEQLVSCTTTKQTRSQSRRYHHRSLPHCHRHRNHRRLNDNIPRH